MLKKLLAVAGGVVLASVLLFGLDVGDYARTAWQRCRSAIRQRVPVEFELERARGMIGRLDVQIKRELAGIARGEVELDEFVAQTAALRRKMERQKEEIGRLHRDLTSGNAEFVYAGRRYTADAVKADLARRFHSYKNAAEHLAGLEKLAQARRQMLRAAHEQVDNMRRAKEALEIEVASLEARHKLMEAAQARSRQAIDQSQLSRTKQLVAQIRRRIAAAERLLAWEKAPAGQIPVGTEKQGEDLDELAQYFGLDQPAKTQTTSLPTEAVTGSEQVADQQNDGQSNAGYWPLIQRLVDGAQKWLSAATDPTAAAEAGMAAQPKDRRETNRSSSQ